MVETRAPHTRADCSAGSAAFRERFVKQGDRRIYLSQTAVTYKHFLEVEHE